LRRKNIKIDNQDFEAYARFKPFNYDINHLWADSFEAAVELTGRTINELKILDYGCGDGKYFPYFISKGIKREMIFGLEVSHERALRCQKIGWENVVVIEPDSFLQFEDHTFDIINFMEVIEHIPENLGYSTVKELTRVLRPNGVMLIATPNYPIKRFYDFSDALFHKKWERLRDDPTHVTFYSYKSLATLLPGHFKLVIPKPFKPGYLYKYLALPIFLHKLFFLCQK
jgi:2-polyprenyl-3-methyl-5-hydroxy-6-metoxy-1,4-benzoquinol methylase